MTADDLRADEGRKRLNAALDRAAAGDSDGLRNVYDLTSAKLFGICLRISGDREAAEDILQEVYIKVWRRAGSYDSGRASPITWLATIARNAALDWRRASGRHDTLPDDRLAAVADDAPLADGVLEAGEARARLMACLDGLDPVQAGAIRRAFMDGLTYQQLADQDATPLGTVKSWIRRGMQRLKECLGDG
jgi:RNA polymerase sigma-70 factor (ECF subfamily)